MNIKIFAAKADKNNLHSFFEFIDQYCPDVLEEKLDAIKLVFEEVFVNISDYAYQGKRKMVYLVFNQKTQELKITFIDKGPAFNPLTKPDPDIEHIEKEGGFGVFFIKKLSDDVSYHRLFGKNILTVVFQKISLNNSSQKESQ